MKSLFAVVMSTSVPFRKGLNFHLKEAVQIYNDAMVNSLMLASKANYEIVFYGNRMVVNF